MVDGSEQTNGNGTDASRHPEAELGINTLLVHAGLPKERPYGAAIMPIFQNVTYTPDPTSDTPFFYLRCDHPNARVVGKKIAALEGTDGGIVFSSGQAAITACMLSLLQPGDHFITQKTLYGGTYSVFYEELERLNIELTAIDVTEPESWEKALRPNTKVIYVEAICNPLLEVGDLKGVISFAKKHNLRSVIDSTFAPPVNFKPASIGFDAIIHSATKYANGHSDICAGILASRSDIHAKAMKKMEQYGGCLDPHACFLLQRGMATLKLRVEQQNKNGLAIAQFMAKHPKVEKVNYPGLKSSKGHEYAKELFSGFGGVLSAELKGGATASQAFHDALRILFPAVSLGGVESLVCVPATSTHRILGAEGRKASGISDGLIRLALGIEDTEDLLADISQALDRVPA